MVKRKKSLRKVIFHKDRARDLLCDLMDSADVLLGGDTDLVPEKMYSKGFRVGYLPHARYLFFSIALDALRDSYAVYRAGAEIARDYSNSELIQMANCYTFNDFLGVTEKKTHLDRLLERVMDNGVGKPSEIIHRCALKLETEYGGDPRNIFEDGDNYDDVQKKLLEFQGIADGKAALMVKNFIRFGYFDLENRCDMPIKIDRHMIKMSIGSRVVELENVKKGEEVHINLFDKKLAKLYREITVEEEFDPILLDDLKWANGARHCTTKDLSTCNKTCKLDCERLAKMNKSGTYFVYGSDTRTGEGLGNSSLLDWGVKN